MVVVDTERMEGGHRLTELYAVWDPDPAHAVKMCISRTATWAPWAHNLKVGCAVSISIAGAV
jgi:hypothetical protein